MKKMTADEILKYIIELFIYYLNSSEKEYNSDGFVFGERTAYVECLEIIQYWEHSHINGLNFDIEKRFPV